MRGRWRWGAFRPWRVPGAPVVVATRTFAPEPTAAALRLSAFAAALAEGGSDVFVLTSRIAPGAGEGAPRPRRPSPAPGGRVRVRRAPVLRDATGAVRGYVPYLSFDAPLVGRLLACPRPALVVCEPPPTTGSAVRLACAARGVPYVYYAADIVSDAAAAGGAPRPVVVGARALERFALGGAERVIAVSAGVAERARRLGAEGVAVVPNGVDCSRPPFPGPLPEGFPGGQGPVFVYAGTVAPWLAPEVFVDALRLAGPRLPGARLVFLGQGSGWEALRERARGVEGVSFHAPVSADEAHAWLAAATASLASLRPGGYSYAYPTKILSSLAAGTPVVYAGEGEAAQDVASADLGAAVRLDAAAVAGAMVAVAERAAEGGWDRLRLWRWVRQHRSAVRSSKLAALAALGIDGPSS